MLLEIANRAEAVKQQGEIRERIQKQIRWFRDKMPELDRRWMELAGDCFIVRKFHLWREWPSKKDGEAFKTFEQWIAEETGRSRGQIYQLMDCAEFLPLSHEEMADLGQKKCKDLVVLAKADPGKLKGVIAEVRANPDMVEKDVKHLVYSALDGQHINAERFEYFEFAVRRSEAKIIEDALKVMQERDRLDHPNNATARGRHLVFMATEWLQDEEQVQLLKKLRKEGVIDAAAEVEIDESD